MFLFRLRQQDGIFSAKFEKPSSSAVFAKPSYISVHSKFFRPPPQPRVLRGVALFRQVLLNHIFACSFFVVRGFQKQRGNLLIALLFSPLKQNKLYLFLAWDSPAKAASRFFSVCVPAYLLAIILSPFRIIFLCNRAYNGSIPQNRGRLFVL